MIPSCLFSSDKSSVWNPKLGKELLSIPEDELNQLHSISVWSKDTSNSQDKDKAESSVQNSQCFGLESQFPSTKPEESQDIHLKNSLSFNQHPQNQNQVLYRSKIKSVSLSELSKPCQDLLNTDSLKRTLSFPNIRRKFSSSKTSFNKVFTCNLKTSTKTMEVITQLDMDVSTHVKKGETNFEVIQEKHEEFVGKEIAVNNNNDDDDQSNNKSGSAEDKDSIQEEESNSPIISCDKMELDPPCIKEAVTNVSDENESQGNAEKYNDVVELDAATTISCDKIESDVPIAKPTVSNTESFQDKNQQLDLHLEEKTNDTVEVNVVTSTLCDKMELDPNAKNAVTENASSSDKTNHVNEKKSEETAKLDISAPTSCDKMELDPNANDAVTENASTSDKTNLVNVKKSEETAKLDISAPTSCDKMELDSNAKNAVTENASTSDKTNHVNEKKSEETAKLDISAPTSCDNSGVKQIVTETTNTSNNKHELHLDSQNMDEKQELSKQNTESSNNVFPMEQSAEINMKKINVPEANQNLCNLGVTEKPCQEFASFNVPNETPIAKTAGKKRKLESKSKKISKKRKSQEKHGQVDTRNKFAGDIHFSPEEIGTLLDIIKQFL